MNRRSFFTAIFIITFLLVTISFAQARGPGRGRFNSPEQGMGKGPMHGNVDSCLEELDLSPDQIARIKKIREEHRENMDRIREEMHNYRTQQRKHMQQEADVDDKSLEELLNQGSEMWKEREREKMRYRRQISALLTQEQRDRLYMCKGSGPKPRWEGRKGSPPIPPEE